MTPPHPMSRQPKGSDAGPVICNHELLAVCVSRKALTRARQGRGPQRSRSLRHLAAVILSCSGSCFSAGRRKVLEGNAKSFYSGRLFSGALFLQLSSAPPFTLHSPVMFLPGEAGLSLVVLFFPQTTTPHHWQFQPTTARERPPGLSPLSLSREVNQSHTQAFLTHSFDQTHSPSQ